MDRKKVRSRTNYRFIVVEYSIWIYVVITMVINILNIFKVFNFTSWFMQHTFYAPSLLILLIVQFGLISINKSDTFLLNIRPYIIGVMVANIFSVGRLTFCLMLLLVCTCCFWTGGKQGYSVKGKMIVILMACTGIEIYSILHVFSGTQYSGCMGSFMNSMGPDVMLVVALIFYIAVTYEENGIVHAEVEMGKKHFIINAVNGLYNWIILKQKTLVRSIRFGLCVVAIGLFILYSVTISTGEDRIRNTEEEVYLLQHRENTSLVLTLVECEEGNKIEFREYVGTNNQKIQIVDVGDGTFRYVFLEPRLAIEMSISEENEANVILLNEESDKEEQRWNKGFWLGIDNFEMVTRITKDGDIPIYYQTLAQSDGIPKVGIGIGSGGHEYFPMERTISNEFITKIIATYKGDFQPTEMISININRFSGGSYLLFFMIAFIFCTIIYARRIIGDKCGMLNAIIFAFLLAYGAISVIVLFLVAFGLQCYLGFIARRNRISKKNNYRN